ncbi:flavin reductase family protein [Polymorphospora rubra]|uniref:flavin reductase family protein n=1 Tax=Polymorphospora rubra TaxID=338584 RepID=UPI0033F3FAC8
MIDDVRSFRDCLGQFASGVTVVTVGGAQGVHGSTVSAFTSVSLQPPLVLVVLDRRSRLCRRIDGQPFGINVLAASQRDLALHFAGAATGGSGSVPIGWDTADDTPRLSGATAFLSCQPWALYDGGDHLIVLGRVCSFATLDADPLVYHRGSFHELAAPPLPSAWQGSFDCPADGMWALDMTSA